ncbi:hypothetical protein ACFE33_04755 [Falsihalocynthiibacter sp. SS001]|uniref:hypothetical protein n=1 Tax=Falsihalocynthiibacter sp. SS001 TaxID=3349698 RepID=UPI0036D2753C
MSDPVTNVEIEDVVSSIRRLFKEDKTAPKEVASVQKKQEKTEVEQSEPSNDCLILTPEFRVDRGRKNAAPESQEPVSDSESAATAKPSHRLHLSVPEKSDSSDVLVLGSWQRAKDERESSAVDAIMASIARQSSLASTIAELEAAISDQGGEFEPDGSETIGSLPENAPLQWQDSSAPKEVKSEDKAEIIELDAEGPQEVDPAFIRRHAAPKEREQVVAPPRVLDEVIKGDALALSNLGLDEVAMRDLVSEVIRQELQGALGERITRNVRKLVRREIHRIVSSQDFD